MDVMKRQELKLMIASLSVMMNTKEDFSSSDSSNSSDLSESGEEMSTTCAIVMIGQTRGTNIPRERLFDYVERVVPGYSRQQFKEHFR